MRHLELAPQLSCRRCETDLLLAVEIPARYDEHGRWSEGRRYVGLCPQCDRDSRAAQGLLAYIARHGHLTQDTLDEAATLIDEWVHQVTEDPPGYTDEELDADIAAWKRGEM